MVFDAISSCFFRRNLHKLFFQCRRCKEVVVVTARFAGRNPLSQGRTGDIRDYGVKIQSICPPVSEPVEPEGTPGDVAKDFVEGLKVLSAEAYPSAGNCFRRALEKATKHLINKLGSDSKEHIGKNLYDQIKVLRDNFLITPSLYDWAEIIRDFGNKGSHGDADFAEEDAVELKNFTEIFLIHVFTMPAKVRKIRTTMPPNKKK